MDQPNDCQFYIIQLQSKIINSFKSNQTLNLQPWQTEQQSIPSSLSVASALLHNGISNLFTEGLDSWIAFILIDYDDFLSIANNAFRHIAPFSLGVLKQKRLAALKFWIEDMIRMNEPHTTAAFTSQVMLDCIELYAAYVKAKVESVEFFNGPQFDPDDWIGFETGTGEWLASIQGNNGVPLSYLLRDNRL